MSGFKVVRTRGDILAVAIKLSCVLTIIIYIVFMHLTDTVLSSSRFCLSSGLIFCRESIRLVATL
jgi:hypothetical protein